MNAASRANPVVDEDEEADAATDAADAEARGGCCAVGRLRRSSKLTSSSFDTGYDWMSWTQHH
jgi:hypothetical protein